MAFHVAAMHAARLFGGYRPIGGGGLAHWLVRLFIWHEIWRFGRAIWHIPTFGPIIIILLIAAVVALGVLRSRGGPGWLSRGGPGWLSRRRGGSAGAGTGTGPRDW